MTAIDKSIYYYLILFATFLFTFSFVPLVFEIIQQRLTINIPYISLICMLIASLIYLFITIHRQYYLHIIFYLISFICISIILFLKKNYDKKNMRVSKIVYDS
jgi:uncharacterized protein with PQ loop repeat